MKLKNTLELFDELVQSGIPEAQARVQLMQMGTTTDLVERVEKDLFWMRLIGGGMIVACFAVMFK